MIWPLLSLVSLASFAVAENATRCFECNDLPHPADCTTVTVCAQGQTCLVEQFITSGGLVLFNSGCLSRVRCNAGGRRDIPQYSSLSKRSDITTCDQCCEGDFCNDQGCGNTALKQPQRGPLCFQCEVEGSPSSCRHLEKCDSGEVCMLTQLPTKAPNGATLYKTACVTPMVCKAYERIGKKRNTYCHVCCDGDFCNDRCEAPVTPAPTTTTTTTPAPTTTTTTTATPPTTATMTRRPTPADRCHHHHYNYDNPSHLCYKFHYERTTWDVASGVCKQEGGTLAIIDTQDKWNFLRNKVKNDPRYNQNIYIGARTPFAGLNTFYWQNGAEVTRFYWASGEPNGGLECISLNINDDYGWHDIACNKHYSFICTIQGSV